MRDYVDYTTQTRYENARTYTFDGDVIEEIPPGLRKSTALDGNWLPLRTPFLVSEIRGGAGGLRPYRVVIMLWQYNEYVVNRFYTDTLGGYGNGTYIRFGNFAGRTQEAALRHALHVYTLKTS